MQWTPDVAAGDWIRERLDDPWRGTMHDAVPRGFPAYARVFHPVTRERPVDRPWPPLPFDRHRREWDAFHEAGPQIDAEPSSWAQTAAAMGTTMHPLAQWTRLVAPGVIVENEDFPRDRDGWRYLTPQEGRLDPAALAALAQVLADHTTTPDAGGIAVWEGWGDLVGAERITPGSAALFGGPDMPRRYADYAAADDDDDSDDAVANRHRQWISASLHDVFNNPFRKPTWQPGILSDEISRGPRLQLPDRDHVLFRGGISEFADPTWPAHVPWAEPGLDPRNATFVTSPALVWPDDHAWVMVTEIDWDSTIVAGSADLVAAIVADPRLEAAQIPAGADLQWDADEVNR